ncbi:hypothetical protein CEXT_151921 [Caerostris extrusa]|uniref:Uncharacterized protein n=1 Tax=Caerostris extrusa TaxID=172846 RepID=A0AAV4P034_CAEEX|nr:hypothetical protein CEXT_151921 [Caerostris extrusa]
MQTCKGSHGVTASIPVDRRFQEALTVAKKVGRRKCAIFDERRKYEAHVPRGPVFLGSIFSLGFVERALTSDSSESSQVFI